MLYLKSLIGIKGRIQTREFEQEAEKRKQVVEIIAEKVTFLSSKKEEK
ncbi:MAG: single-stranded DNA-binding protein [Ignavibacteriales bacterium]